MIRTQGLAQFRRFCLVGCLGFVVDAGTLQWLVQHAVVGPYVGRVVSYSCAVVVTWILNRHFTFGTSSTAAHAQLVRYLAVNTVGTGANYLVYSFLVMTSALVHAHLYLGVAAGSLAGLAFNFMLSKRWVFGDASTVRHAGGRCRQQKHPEPTLPHKP